MAYQTLSKEIIFDDFLLLQHPLNFNLTFYKNKYTCMSIIILVDDGGCSLFHTKLFSTDPYIWRSIYLYIYIYITRVIMSKNKANNMSKEVFISADKLFDDYCKEILSRGGYLDASDINVNLSNKLDLNRLSSYRTIKNTNTKIEASIHVYWSNHIIRIYNEMELFIIKNLCKWQNITDIKNTEFLSFGVGALNKCPTVTKYFGIINPTSTNSNNKYNDSNDSIVEYIKAFHSYIRKNKNAIFKNPDYTYWLKQWESTKIAIEYLNIGIRIDFVNLYHALGRGNLGEDVDEGRLIEDIKKEYVREKTSLLRERIMSVKKSDKGTDNSKHNSTQEQSLLLQSEKVLLDHSRPETKAAYKAVQSLITHSTSYTDCLARLVDGLVVKTTLLTTVSAICVHIACLAKYLTDSESFAVQPSNAALLSEQDDSSVEPLRAKLLQASIASCSADIDPQALVALQQYIAHTLRTNTTLIKRDENNSHQVWSIDVMALFELLVTDLTRSVKDARKKHKTGHHSSERPPSTTSLSRIKAPYLLVSRSKGREFGFTSLEPLEPLKSLGPAYSPLDDMVEFATLKGRKSKPSRQVIKIKIRVSVNKIIACIKQALDEAFPTIKHRVVNVEDDSLIEAITPIFLAPVNTTPTPAAGLGPIRIEGEGEGEGDDQQKGDNAVPLRDLMRGDDVCKMLSSAVLLCIRLMHIDCLRLNVPLLLAPVTGPSDPMQITLTAINTDLPVLVTPWAGLNITSRVLLSLQRLETLVRDKVGVACFDLLSLGSFLEFAAGGERLSLISTALVSVLGPFEATSAVDNGAGLSAIGYMTICDVFSEHIDDWHEALLNLLDELLSSRDHTLGVFDVLLYLESRLRERCQHLLPSSSPHSASYESITGGLSFLHVVSELLKYRCDMGDNEQGLSDKLAVLLQSDNNATNDRVLELNDAGDGSDVQPGLSQHDIDSLLLQTFIDQVRRCHFYRYVACLLHTAYTPYMYTECKYLVLCLYAGRLHHSSRRVRS